MISFSGKQIKFLIVVPLFLLNACMTQKKLELLQGDYMENIEFEAGNKPTNLIRENDELFINVSSFDANSFNYFQKQEQSGGYAINSELGIAALSYTVSQNGDIDFPLVGLVNVGGKSLVEAANELEEKLDPYFDQPTAVFKFAFKKFSVLGEVNIPGHYTYSRDQLNILEALGMAGDITIHGNRESVYLIRETNGKNNKIILDLTKDEILSSDYYYLRSGDILYIPPEKSVKWNATSVPVGLFLSAITTALLILNFISN